MSANVPNAPVDPIEDWLRLCLQRLGPKAVALFDYAEAVDKATQGLNHVLDGGAAATKMALSVASAVRALAGVATIMAEREFFADRGRIGNLARDGSVAALRDQCTSFVRDATRRITEDDWPSKEARAALNNRLAALEELFWSADGRAIVKDFAEDETVPAETRRSLLDSLGEMAWVPALEAIARTSSDRLVADTCKDALEAADKKSVLGMTTEKLSALTKASKVTAAVSAMGGNILGADGLVLTMLKIYAASYLPEAASNPDTASKIRAAIDKHFEASLNLSKEELVQLAKLNQQVAESKANLRSASEAAGSPTSELSQRVAAEDAETKYGAANEEVSDFIEKKTQNLHGLRDGSGENVALTVFALIQAVDAIRELSSSRGSASEKASHGVDLVAAGVTAGGGVVSIAKGAMKAKIARSSVLDAEKLVDTLKTLETVGKVISRTAVVLMIVSGGLQVWDGLEQNDPTKIMVGGASVASGVLILVGWTTSVGAFVGIGEVVGIVIAAYAGWTVVDDLITADTQKFFDNAMSRLNTIYTVHSDEGAWSSLANTSFEGIEDAVKATAFFTIPLSDELDADYSLQRRLLVTRISALGISHEMAELMVEDVDDARSRYAHPEPDMPETLPWV